MSSALLLLEQKRCVFSDGLSPCRGFEPTANFRKLALLGWPVYNTEGYRRLKRNGNLTVGSTNTSELSSCSMIEEQVNVHVKWITMYTKLELKDVVCCCHGIYFFMSHDLSWNCQQQCDRFIRAKSRLGVVGHQLFLRPRGMICRRKYDTIDPNGYRA